MMKNKIENGKRVFFVSCTACKTDHQVARQDASEAADRARKSGWATFSMGLGEPMGWHCKACKDRKAENAPAIKRMFGR